MEKEFYNKAIKKWFDNNNTLIYSDYTESKSVIAERCLRPLKANDELNDEFNDEYNNNYHCSICKKHVYLKVLYQIIKIINLLLVIE